MHRSRLPFALLLLGMLLALPGCAKTPPAFTPAEGILLLNGQPVPYAQVDFMPELTDYGAEMNSTGVTDTQGKFKLTMWNGQNGAAVSSHRVVVIDAPPPEEARRMDEVGQMKLREFMSKMSNRPIPAQYGNYSQTPLRVEVTADKASYTINLVR
jgi:hypothetical protein